MYLAERPSFFQYKRRRELTKDCHAKIYGLALISAAAVFAAAFLASRSGWIFFGYGASPAALAWMSFWTAAPLAFFSVLMSAIYCGVRTAKESAKIAEVFD
jgi:hypothetical protein